MVEPVSAPLVGEIASADVAWMLVASALVLMMTPALAFFYGGLVRRKNALNTMMMSFASLGVVGVVWALLGYSLAFAPSAGGVFGGFVGGLDHAFLRGVGLDAVDGTGIPHLLFMAFQGTFAIITAALISGAVAERMRFEAYGGRRCRAAAAAADATARGTLDVSSNDVDVDLRHRDADRRDLTSTTMKLITAIGEEDVAAVTPPRVAETVLA